MEAKNEIVKEVGLENIITGAIQIPGVKVNRSKFLAETFASGDVILQDILDLGPIEAGISREDLSDITKKLIFKRTSQSSLASFAAGIPGGLAMAATVPADVMQFFGMALRLAQEISYLYGANDLWDNGKIDDERVKSQLIMYCGVMFGVSGAVSGVRVLSIQIAKNTLKKLPQKALTKTFWYPIVKQIGKSIGIKVTKSTVAKGISKAIPVIGGVISGSLNFASMMPMANRLQKTLDKASFDYTEEEMQADIDEIENIVIQDVNKETDSKNNLSQVKDKFSNSIKNVSKGISGIVSNRKSKESKSNQTDEVIANIEKLAKLKDMGVITQEEFDEKKAELLLKI